MIYHQIRLKENTLLVIPARIMVIRRWFLGMQVERFAMVIGLPVYAVSCLLYNRLKSALRER